LTLRYLQGLKMADRTFSPLLTIKIFIENSQMQTFATAFNYWQQTKASGSLPPSIQIGITWTEAK
jgi:hypothetical protein